MGRAVVDAVNNRDDSEKLADISSNIGKGMKGEANVDMKEEDKFQERELGRR